jgi:hypothetical protein
MKIKADKNVSKQISSVESAMMSRKGETSISFNGALCSLGTALWHARVLITIKMFFNSKLSLCEWIAGNVVVIQFRMRFSEQS